MDGSASFDAALAYVSRLTGQDVSLDQKLGLRSIHRVALASWARKENLKLRASLINSIEPFSLRDLLSDDGIAAGPATPAPAFAAETDAAPLIGIDIEEVASLPAADDYREHPFYRDNFSPAEIAYCVRQPDERAAFCGTWAAKEAVLKSGAPGTLSRLGAIEILRDDRGRPTYPGCTLSISHTASTAVAVCLRQPAPAAAASPPRPPADFASGVGPETIKGGRRQLAILALIVIGIVAILAFGVWKLA
jgi:phosphopantetheine--protein transferase-like protein